MYYLSVEMRRKKCNEEDSLLLSKVETQMEDENVSELRSERERI
jgi:hypothetical protein